MTAVASQEEEEEQQQVTMLRPHLCGAFLFRPFLVVTDDAGGA